MTTGEFESQRAFELAQRPTEGAVAMAMQASVNQIPHETWDLAKRHMILIRALLQREKRGELK